MSIQIGIGEIDWTPPVGLPLLGNLRQDYSSKGIHDPLFAKAIVVAGPDSPKLALLTMDICMLNRQHIAFMRNYIANRCDIPARNILIAATHIHSGPAALSIYCMPKTEDEQIEAFLKKAAEAVVIANDNLATAEITIGCSKEEQISFYRRLRDKAGKTHMNWEGLEPELIAGPLGEIDPQVIALSVIRNGKPAAALVNFALHPAILDYENELYSAEYPGCLANAMSENFGQEFKTLFFNGCCGNINHIDYKQPSANRRGYEVIENTGNRLAVAAQAAMQQSYPVQGDIVAVSRELVPLTRLKIDEETYQWSLDAVERLKHNPPAGAADGLPKEYSGSTWIEMYELQNSDDQAEVMVIRIGDIAIIGLPGEVFCEFGMEIKAKSPAKQTIVIELANDAVGYLPTSEAFSQGGYEVTPGATKYEHDAGERLTASVLRQLNKLFNK